MRAYIAVLAHPFFAVSDSNGAFTIKGLPPGEYEIEAWHEKYGAKNMKVKVGRKSPTRRPISPSTARWPTGRER